VRGAYVVQRASGVAELDDLDGSLEAVETLVVEAAVAGLLDAVFKVCAVRLLEAEDAGARLVEAVGQADVEVCRVGAQGEVNECQGARVAAVDLDGAAGQRPLGAVGNIGCLVDVGAWECVLVAGWELVNG
jgi:hypothetical protein